MKTIIKIENYHPHTFTYTKGDRNGQEDLMLFVVGRDLSGRFERARIFSDDARTLEAHVEKSTPEGHDVSDARIFVELTGDLEYGKQVVKNGVPQTRGDGSPLRERYIKVRPGGVRVLSGPALEWQMLRHEAAQVMVKAHALAEGGNFEEAYHALEGLLSRVVPPEVDVDHDLDVKHEPAAEPEAKAPEAPASAEAEVGTENNGAVEGVDTSVDEEAPVVEEEVASEPETPEAPEAAASEDVPEDVPDGDAATPPEEKGETPAAGQDTVILSAEETKKAAEEAAQKAAEAQAKPVAPATTVRPAAPAGVSRPGAAPVQRPGAPAGLARPGAAPAQRPATGPAAPARPGAPAGLARPGAAPAQRPATGPAAQPAAAAKTAEAPRLDPESAAAKDAGLIDTKDLKPASPPAAARPAAGAGQRPAAPAGVSRPGAAPVQRPGAPAGLARPGAAPAQRPATGPAAQPKPEGDPFDEPANKATPAARPGTAPTARPAAGPGGSFRPRTVTPQASGPGFRR
jgi:hypothetical protein